MDLVTGIISGGSEGRVDGGTESGSLEGWTDTFSSSTGGAEDVDSIAPVVDDDGDDGGDDDVDDDDADE